MRAFSQNVAAVSSGSGIGGRSASVIRSIGRETGQRTWISRTLFGLVVPRRSFMWMDRGTKVPRYESITITC